MLKPVVRRLTAPAALALGLFLLAMAGWLVAVDVWPQVRETGWSLTGRSTILNHEWNGNELYVLIALYAGLGLGAVVAGALLWRSPRGARRPGRVVD